MHIKLINFQNADDVEYDFPSDAHVSLIKGESGCGKTTIFDAIQWALFGVGTDVVNMHHPKTAMSVTLKTASITVLRIRKVATSTRELTVTADGKTWNDEAAQGIIDRVFGNKISWAQSSYISSKFYHVLIDGTQSEKIQFLNSMIYMNDDPEKYIQTSKNKLSSLVTSHKVAVELRDRYKLNMGDTPTDLHPDPAAEIERYTDLILNAKEYAKLEARVSANVIDVSDQPVLSQWYTTQTLPDSYIPYECISDIPLLSDSDIERLKYATRKHTDYISKLSKIGIPVDYANIHLLGIDTSSVVENYNIWSKQEALGIPRDISPDKIKQDHKKYANYLQIQKLCAVYHEQIDNLRPVIQRLIETNYQRTRIRQLSKAGDISDIPRLESIISSGNHKVYTCPHCSKNVCMSSDKLHATDKSVVKVLPTSEFERLKVVLQQLKELKELKSDSGIPDTDRTIEQLTADLKIASREYVSEPPVYKVEDVELMNIRVPSDTVSRYTDLLPAIEAQKKYGRHVIEVVPCPDYYYPSIVKRFDYERQVTSLQASDIPKKVVNTFIEKGKKATLDMVKEYLDKCSRYTTALSELAAVNKPTESVEYMQSMIRCMGIHQQYYRDKKLLDMADKEVEQITEKLALASEYHKTLLDLESQVIQRALVSINYVLESFCGELFDLPMLVSIDLFKTSQDGKSTRPVVNLNIMFNGINRKIRKLSAGEMDRITLALMAAFSQFSPSPMVLIDEILNRISELQRENAIRCIRKYIPHKRVFYIGHKDTEHIFDHVLSLTT